MLKKRILRAFIVALAAALALASCELSGVTSNLSDDASSDARSLSSRQTGATKIYCTASLPPEVFFFEFDLTGEQKTARVLLPHGSGGYIKGKVIRYKAEEFELDSFYYDPASGAIMGQTEEEDDVSYAFQGSYAPDQGFFGYITRVEDGVASSGTMGGVPIFPGSGMSNYVGEATYLFQTPTPQTLLFNVAVSEGAGPAYGTWCESGVGWGYSLHGSVSGTGDSKGVSITAVPLPMFRPYMLYDMSAVGAGTYKNRSKRDISGTFDITYGPMFLPSLITATKEIR